MAHPIEKKIAEREASIVEIDRQLSQLEMQRATLRAEVCAYRDTLQYFNPTQARPRRAAIQQSSDDKAKRGISSTWAMYLAAASQFGRDAFGIDDIVSAGELNGHDMKRPSVRTQAANMVTRGILDRVTPGTFRVTETGWKEIQGSLPNENGPPEGGPDAEQNANSAQYPNPTSTVFD